MGMLVFLAANFLLSLPFRYLGDGTIFRYLLPLLAFMGLVLILPGMALGAFLGFRTYRAPKRTATRAGAGLGALIGWTGFFALAWAANSFGLGNQDRVFHIPVFPDISNSVLSGAFLPLVILATVIVLFSLNLRDANFQQRRRIAAAGAALALLAGLLVMLTGFDPLGVAGVVISTASATLGGWVGGFGYARAGGDEMLPPEATRVS